jgi:hypothetical protein
MTDLNVPDIPALIVPADMIVVDIPENLPSTNYSWPDLNVPDLLDYLPVPNCS